MHRMIHITGFTAVAALLLGGCASTDGSSRDDDIASLLSDPRVGEEVDSICFTRGIDGFSNATENSVVLRRTFNEEYLVVTRVCPDLDFANSLAIDGNDRCLRRQDRFRVFRSPFGPSPSDVPAFDLCLIDGIYEWNEDAPVEDMDAG